MVQLTKNKLKRETPGVKTTRTTKVKYTDKRKAAPSKAKKPTHERKVTSAINKNIEAIMTARVKHAGGHLNVLKAPDNVYDFAKGGARLSEKQMGFRADQTKWRRVKTSERQKELQLELDRNIRQMEKARLKKLLRQQQRDAEIRREKLHDPIHHEELSDDDVAGNFFDQDIGEDFQPEVQPLAPEVVGAKVSRKKQKEMASTSANANSKLTTEEREVLESKKIAHLGRSAGFRGVRDKASAKLLEESF